MHEFSIEGERETLLWKARGFEPAIGFDECYNSFTLDEARASLFDSTRETPVAVTLKDERYSDIGRFDMPIVLDLARPLWIPGDIGSADVPDWFFRAWELESGDRVRSLRIHVSTNGNRTFLPEAFFSWQYEASASP